VHGRQCLDPVAGNVGSVPESAQQEQCDLSVDRVVLDEQDT